ncbi:hypothetical protein F5883DRAFT_557844 [Diaporthe sp. PMI_573]|nr:hypothetical protein F5883DRAFT_557844 [Diaporthaceae sp. PMI_573]
MISRAVWPGCWPGHPSLIAYLSLPLSPLATAHSTEPGTLHCVLWYKPCCVAHHHSVKRLLLFHFLLPTGTLSATIACEDDLAFRLVLSSRAVTMFNCLLSKFTRAGRSSGPSDPGCCK